MTLDYDSESVPFGISMITGNSSIIPTASRGSSSACSDPDSFKVAIIDSGLEVGHPDIPCLPIDHPDTNCKGVSIGIDDDWHNPKGKAGHGTHIFGIIGAVGGNGEGVSGMLPDSDGICYLIARVVDDDGKGSFASSTFHALDWAVSEGANVINISMSAKTYFQAGQVAVTSAHEHGALVVASVGNFGLESMRYPAGFDHVLGVAAVQNDGERASFSQHNDKVDVAAPGVGILSTYLGGQYASMSGTSMAAPHVAGAIAKVWSVCRQCSNTLIENCLLTTASASSDRNNEIGFGVVNAADTYNCLVNTDGCCADATHVGPQSGVEVNEKLDISAPSGGILSIWLEKVAAIEPQSAEVARHSSEEISKLWSVCRQCSNAQIESCLLATGMDAPSKTYDASADVFHAADTYDCLVSDIGCCTE
jgi:serine protease